MRPVRKEPFKARKNSFVKNRNFPCEGIVEMYFCPACVDHAWKSNWYGAGRMP